MMKVAAHPPVIDRPVHIWPDETGTCPSGRAEAILVAEILLLLLVGRFLGEVMQRLGQPALMGNLLAGLVLEPLATGPLGRWAYAEGMPVVPLLGVGLSPALQWILLPPLVAWFVRRQLN